MTKDIPDSRRRQGGRRLPDDDAKVIPGGLLVDQRRKGSRVQPRDSRPLPEAQALWRPAGLDAKGQPALRGSAPRGSHTSLAKSGRGH